jgi:hypothetical protein
MEKNFDLDLIKSLSQNDAKEYLTKYFIPLTDGRHAFYFNGEYKIKETKEIKETYFNRISKELNNYYFKEFTKLKTIGYKLNAPLFFGDNFINFCFKMKASKKYDSYEEYDDESKEGVNTVLNFIKEVLASNNEESYNYLIKWLANMLKGNKNDSCLYLRGEQGIGKSTLFEFLQFHVLGKLYMMSGSETLKKDFNNLLEGRLLIVFEELETMSKYEWMCSSSKLKRYITSKTYNIEKKCVDAYETENINNYIINSNQDAIKDDDGRRYFILDVSDKYYQDHCYFGQLREKIFNDEIGDAFYSYMLEVNTNNFNAQKYPITQSKKYSYLKRIPIEYLFIKEEFILKKNNLFQKPKDLYQNFREYYLKNNNQKGITNEVIFREKLEKIGIIKHKCTQARTYYYKKTVCELIEIFKKRNWYSEDDEFEDENISIENVKIIVEQEEIKEKDNLLKEKDDLLKEKDDLLKEKDIEIEKLKETILQLELIKLQKKTKINDNQERAITFKNNKIEDPKEEDDLAL